MLIAQGQGHKLEEKEKARDTGRGWLGRVQSLNVSSHSQGEQGLTPDSAVNGLPPVELDCQRLVSNFVS